MINFDKWFDVPHENSFKEQYECTFEPDPRIVELEQRYKELYDVPDISYSTKRIQFKQWCKECGYTREEIRNAKQHVSSLR